jgi:hypothetical protein
MPPVPENVTKHSAEMEMGCHDSSEELLHYKTRNSAGVFLPRRTACLPVFTYADVFIYIQQLLDGTMQ